MKPFASKTFVAFAAASALLPLRGAGAETDLRPPSVPLVTFNPYLSVWSPADHLNEATTQHWTKRDHALVSLIRIDGQTYRLMGNDPVDTPVLPQVGLKVLPTRSIYEFENAAVHVTMTFTTAALPSDLNVLSRPLSYITWEVKSVDGAAHTVSLYDSTSSQLAVNTPEQPVVWKRATFGPLTALSVGTKAQTLLTPPGDDTRIDWGYAYAAANSAQSKSAIGGDAALTASFVKSGALTATDDSRMPRPTTDDQPVLAFTFDLGKVGKTAVSRHISVAYDEIYTVKFFGENLRPYWRRNGATPSTMLQAAEKDYADVQTRCASFDTELMADLTKVGGAKYAQITALAYRQCFAANGLAADKNGKPLFFTKENTSNGDIATVDVIFPMEPIWIMLSPTLAKASLAPVLAYGASDHWKFPNSPHDLGTYPVARGTDDGGEQMPVEESGNILIDCDAIAKAEGNADFVTPWWPQITQWAQYLEQYGLDPEDQLCTDDFMGHLAHNANLSIKGILALAAYSDLCRMRGETANADKYSAIAKADAAHWAKVADAGDHSLLAFDKPNTWSQKYNLVWDKVLGLNVFPDNTGQKEVTYYKTVMQKYGVPLDSRTHITKTDWSIWSATLADNQADFEAVITPIYDYLNTTTSRSPIMDSYVTDDIHSDGMHARPVVGGFFIKALTDQAIWKKWASRDTAKISGWAPLPPKPVTKDVVPTSETTPQTWRYTTDKPADNWTAANFDDSSWKEAPAGFGNNGAHHTDWGTADIWIRRTVTLPAGPYRNLQFSVFHDEDIDAYINGVLAATEGGWTTSYTLLDIAPEARALIKPGAAITLAAHVHQTTGGQGVDLGIVDVQPAK
ncbi:hypothetical protein CCAX7_20690 [Capsulimonas corticalis]|uniref:Uncharacterized protein n=1 Tax=Capsulimonas corticalis TaxID=2219043 RepID=A0A402D2A6_9BACT|nr:glutaminase family protein [Capsulimonas corticalis]BDI30018.1 hypothetical protein CCAX7_20690 [Capsulimonas corticalis]